MSRSLNRSARLGIWATQAPTQTPTQTQTQTQTETQTQPQTQTQTQTHQRQTQAHRDTKTIAERGFDPRTFGL